MEVADSAAETPAAQRGQSPPAPPADIISTEAQRMEEQSLLSQESRKRSHRRLVRHVVGEPIQKRTHTGLKPGLWSSHTLPREHGIGAMMSVPHQTFFVEERIKESFCCNRHCHRAPLFRPDGVSLNCKLPSESCQNGCQNAVRTLSERCQNAVRTLSEHFCG